MLVQLQKEVIRSICKYRRFNSLDEIKEVIKAVKASDMDIEDDFFIECNGVEIRVISDSAIDQIWSDELEDLLQECFTIPDFLQGYIDYDKWVRDCKFDGMGHHFSSYDGSERESRNYYYFRTN